MGSLHGYVSIRHRRNRDAVVDICSAGRERPTACGAAVCTSSGESAGRARQVFRSMTSSSPRRIPPVLGVPWQAGTALMGSGDPDIMTLDDVWTPQFAPAVLTDPVDKYLGSQREVIPSDFERRDTSADLAGVPAAVGQRTNDGSDGLDRAVAAACGKQHHVTDHVDHQGSVAMPDFVEAQVGRRTRLVLTGTRGCRPLDH